MTLAERLGAALPLVQAPMAGVQDEQLALAVCDAGGVGSIPAAMLDSERLAAALDRSAGRGPLNVNFFCHDPMPATPEAVAHWQSILAPYYAEYDVEPPTASGAARRPFDDAAVDVIETYRPPIVSFHFGLPAQSLLDRVRATGALVMSSATTVAEARWLEAQGADVIIAQGSEAGGHRGMFLAADAACQVGTFALLPQVVESVSVPVLAAGGIATAAAVRAALALGAAGVQVGTSFLCCDEARTSPLHRAALLDRDRETVLTNVLSGRPARGLRNRVIDETGPMRVDLPPFPAVAGPLAPLRSAAEAQGDTGFSSLWSGQNRSGLQTGPARDVVAALASGFDSR